MAGGWTLGGARLSSKTQNRSRKRKDIQEKRIVVRTERQILTAATPRIKKVDERTNPLDPE